MPGKGALTRNPPLPKRWNDCSPGTCASLVALLGEGDHTGKKVRFNDSFGTSRIFKVAGQNGCMWLLHHPNVVDKGQFACSSGRHDLCSCSIQFGSQ